MNTDKNRLKKFLLFVPLVSCLATVILIELLLSLFYPVPFSIEWNMFFVPDPYTGYRLKADSVGYFHNKIPAVVNSHGCRDDEFTETKRDDVFRILVLGDSFTVGENVALEAAYPQVLEKLLNTHAKKKVEVINAGVSGWGPFHYAQYYEHYGRKFGPDMVVVGFFVGNDAYDNATRVRQLDTAVMGRRIRREAISDRRIRLKLFFYERSHIVRLLLNKGPVVRNFTRKNCEDFSQQHIHIQRSRIWNHLKRSDDLYNLAENSADQISRIKASADSDGAALLVVLIPDENQINPSLQEILIPEEERDLYDFTMPQTMMVEMFSRRDITAIDLLPYFWADPRCLYMSDTHWNPDGHALAATVIAREIGGIAGR